MFSSPQWPYSCVSSTHLKFPCPTYATRAIKRLSFLLFTCSSAQQAFSFKLNHNDDNYDWIIIMYYYWNNCAFCHKNLLVKDCKFSGAENKVNHSCLTPRTTERWSNNNRPTGYFLIPTKRPRSTQKMIQKAGTSLVLSQIYLLNFSLPDNCNSAHPDMQEDITLLHTECLYPTGKQTTLSSALSYQKKLIVSKHRCFTRESCVVPDMLRAINCLAEDQTSMVVLASNLCMVLLGVKAQCYPQQQALCLQWTPNEFITTGHFKWNATPP